MGLHVPSLVRGPGFEPGAEITASSMVFQDINATMRDLGGAEAGLPHQAGVSLAAIAASPDDNASRSSYAIAQGFDTASGDGITTGPDHPLGFRKLYRYPSLETAPDGPFTYEAYDLDDDPDEHANWADDESRRDERDSLESELDALLAWRNVRGRKAPIPVASPAGGQLITGRACPDYDGTMTRSP